MDFWHGGSSALSYRQQRLPGVHRVAYFHSDVGHATVLLSGDDGLHLHCLDYRDLVAGLNGIARLHVDFDNDSAQRCQLVIRATGRGCWRWWGGRRWGGRRCHGNCGSRPRCIQAATRRLVKRAAGVFGHVFDDDVVNLAFHSDLQML